MTSPKGATATTKAFRDPSKRNACPRFSPWVSLEAFSIRSGGGAVVYPREMACNFLDNCRGGYKRMDCVGSRTFYRPVSTSFRPWKLGGGQGREPEYGRLWMHGVMRTRHVPSAGSQDRIHAKRYQTAKSSERASNANRTTRRPFAGRWRGHNAEPFQVNPRIVEDDSGASVFPTVEVSIAFTQMGIRREDAAI